MSAHTAETELKLIGKLILEGELRCETGLHIGAGKGSLEIGGADNRNQGQSQDQQDADAYECFFQGSSYLCRHNEKSVILFGRKINSRPRRRRRFESRRSNPARKRL